MQWILKIESHLRRQELANIIQITQFTNLELDFLASPSTQRGQILLCLPAQPGCQLSVTPSHSATGSQILNHVFVSVKGAKSFACWHCRAYLAVVQLGAFPHWREIPTTDVFLSCPVPFWAREIYQPPGTECSPSGPEALIASFQLLPLSGTLRQFCDGQLYYKGGGGLVLSRPVLFFYWEQFI